MGDVPGPNTADSEGESAEESTMGDAMAHLQVAAHEVGEALKLFGSAAEKAVADPESIGAVIKRLADVGREFVAGLETRDDVESEPEAGPGEDPAQGQ